MNTNGTKKLDTETGYSRQTGIILRKGIANPDRELRDILHKYLPHCTQYVRDGTVAESKYTGRIRTGGIVIENNILYMPITA